MRGFKLAVWIILGVALSIGSSWYLDQHVEGKTRDAMRQFDNDDSVPARMRASAWTEAAVYGGAFSAWGLLGLLLLHREIYDTLTSHGGRDALLVASFLSLTGCYRPYPKVDLQTVETSEEGFLIPLEGDSTQQTSTNSEEDLRNNLITTKRVQIPQRWVKTGYEWLGLPNGQYVPAARLLKVDRAPVTREWTADSNSGTSDRNEAIWVMTSDQVEFSTGWTCTARIASTDDAIKFLHNYPSGSLENVMDTEIRAKLQAEFGLEVTDLPMDELRKGATPHFLAVVGRVDKFFAERGITITNLGITGGFVYKDKTVADTLVKVFNAEQTKNVAAAATEAQREANKKIQLEADAKAKALLTERKAEAEGIQAVADAKAYEIQKAAEKPELYLGLKRIEIEKAKLEKWDGRFPSYFMGGTGGPEMLLNVPAFAADDKK